MYNIHALFPPEPIGPPDLAERLGPILLHLRRAAADRAVKYWAYIPLGLLFAAYLSSVMRRVESLVARHRAGRLRARPHRARTVQPQEERENAAPKRRLPARFGWVVEWLGHHAAGCAAQLRHMLTHDPDLVALLDVGPQAGRVLRPLCRMLGMEPGPDLPPSLFPPRAAKAAPAKATRPEQAGPATPRPPNSSSQALRLRLRPESHREAGATQDPRGVPEQNGSGDAGRLNEVRADTKDQAIEPPVFPKPA